VRVVPLRRRRDRGRRTNERKRQAWGHRRRDDDGDGGLFILNIKKFVYTLFQRRF
jgi:hypothetical protein